MTKCLSTGLILLFSTVVCAQSSPGNDGRSDKTIDFSNVSGNPYLFKDWSEGMVLFSSGRLMKQFRLKFDCAQNRLMLLFNGATFAAESKVKEFFIFQKNGKGKDTMIFRKGFPAAGLGTDETYYQVLTTGKAMLLRLFSKTVVEETPLGAASVQRHFEDNEDFYLLRNNQLMLVNKEKGSLVELLKDHTVELKQFIGESQLKMRSAEDLCRVVRKYNELVQ